LIDVLEHLPEDESLLLLNLAKEHSAKVIFSQIPIGIHEQDGDDWNLGGEYWQTHRSVWTKENFSKFGFSYTEIWEDWYNWGLDVNKSRDTSFAMWIADYDKVGFNRILEPFNGWLKKTNINAWNEAFEKGYNSNMGNHEDYFYNEYITRSGFYSLLDNAESVLEIGGGNGLFIKKLADRFPEKQFFISEISHKAINELNKRFEDYSNVTIIDSTLSQIEQNTIDLAFSFLLCQSMPQSIFKSHLEEIKNVLTDEGSYVFQFAYTEGCSSTDLVGDAIAGNNKYSPEEMFKFLEDAGYAGCDLTGPINLETFNTDIVWYICRVYKKG
jgi:hypothetical protein